MYLKLISTPNNLNEKYMVTPTTGVMLKNKNTLLPSLCLLTFIFSSLFMGLFCWAFSVAAKKYNQNRDHDASDDHKSAAITNPCDKNSCH